MNPSENQEDKRIQDADEAQAYHRAHFGEVDYDQDPHTYLLGLEDALGEKADLILAKKPYPESFNAAHILALNAHPREQKELKGLERSLENIKKVDRKRRAVIQKYIDYNVHFSPTSSARAQKEQKATRELLVQFATYALTGFDGSFFQTAYSSPNENSFNIRVSSTIDSNSIMKEHFKKLPEEIHRETIEEAAKKQFDSIKQQALAQYKIQHPGDPYPITNAITRNISVFRRYALQKAREESPLGGYSAEEALQKLKKAAGYTGTTLAVGKSLSLQSGVGEVDPMNLLYSVARIMGMDHKHAETAIHTDSFKYQVPIAVTIRKTDPTDMNGQPQMYMREAVVSFGMLEDVLNALNRKPEERNYKFASSPYQRGVDQQNKAV